MNVIFGAILLVIAYGTYHFAVGMINDEEWQYMYGARIMASGMIATAVLAAVEIILFGGGAK